MHVGVYSSSAHGTPPCARLRRLILRVHLDASQGLQCSSWSISIICFGNYGLLLDACESRSTTTTCLIA